EMLGLDRGIAAGFYRRNERIGMPIVTVPGRRRQLRQEPTISLVCRAAHGFLRSTTARPPPGSILSCTGTCPARAQLITEGAFCKEFFRRNIGAKSTGYSPDGGW